MKYNVIFTIFAGRKKYMEILNVYLNKLLKKNSIHEVHFWSFTENTEDIDYMKSLETKNSKYKVHYPPSPSKKIWYYYYNYYLTNTNENDIVIKCDDDILYIDIDRFDDFINNINQECINFPNIINNDVCAYYQTQNNIHDLFNYNVEHIINKVGVTHPLTNWFKSFDKANKIHEMFLENNDRFTMNMDNPIEYGNRVSINFFAIHKKAIDKYFSVFRKNHYDDETIFGWAPSKFKKHRINFNFKVVHFQFGPQKGNRLDSLYLDKYKLLANDNKVNL